MVSLFPSLLSYQELSPFILRLTLSLIIILWTYKVIRKQDASNQSKIIAGIQGLFGVLIFLGLWTQLAALIITIDLLYRLYIKYREHALFSDGVNYYFILLIIAISLIFTGPGVLAFDIRL